MEKNTLKLSVVIPLYNCIDSLDELIERLLKSLKFLNNEYEIIFIDDDSPQKEWLKLKSLFSNYKLIKGIKFSRNFGQHAAIFSGIEHSKGEYVVVMDGDLQDRPEEIPVFYKKINEGFDIVLGKRISRQDSFIKKLFSKIFYKIISFLTDTKIDYTVANYGIYSRKAINAVLQLGDRYLFFPVMISWVGFKKSSIEIKHGKRTTGKSSYNFSSLLNLAINIIISFSDKLIKIIAFLGFFITVISIASSFYLVFQYVNGTITVPGYASLIISISLFSGLIISIIGFVGLYIGRILNQVNSRPRFIVDKKINF